MTAVTIKSNKIVLNEVDNSVLLEPSHGKKLNELFGQPNICCIQEAYLRTEDIDRLKVKGWKRDISCK